jgi:pyruvate,water dikinase
MAGPRPPLLDIRTDLPAGLGGKVDGLRWLVDHGYPVPSAKVLVRPTDDPVLLRSVLAAAIDPQRTYAIRSSADVEDGGGTSYAGQFASFLDVSGLDAVVDAVVAVIRSSDRDEIAAYRRHQGDERPVRMSVMIQDMVRPVVSGVAFSKNPITGLSETVVEAVEGSGEHLVSGGETPDRWVHRWGDFIEQPESGSLEPAVVRSIVSAVSEIAEKFGKPVDLEWVYDGARLWWVQIRPITGIADVTIYSRRIAKEVMPGIIKPLVWSVNVPMVNTAWIELFREALGDLSLRPDDLARPFAYRAYFNMSAIGEIFALLGMPRESLELLLGLPAGSEQPGFKPTPATMRRLPRMLVMALRKARYGAEVERTLPDLEEEYGRYARVDVATLSDDRLMADIDDLRRIGVRSASINVVTPLLANAYSSLLRAQLLRHDIEFDVVDLGAGIDTDGLDPNPHLDRLAVRIAALEVAEREVIERDGYGAVPADLQREVDAFLDRFGHFSDSGNDFSVPTWREMPDTVVRMAVARGIAERPSTRHPRARAEARVPRWKRPALRLLQRRTAAFIGYRDAVSSLYTFGYGLFRTYFREIGRRLVERDLIDHPDDVMLLTLDEVRSLVAGESDVDAKDLTRRRAAEIADVVDLTMPDIIFGEDFIPVPTDERQTTSWHGTPTARGIHRGRTRIVRGIGDFDRVGDGDVLVIPFSDVGWTPLFARAGAVVAESGGMLSHSSIVAREYGIPCVVSVTDALSIPEDSEVVVDAYRGVVTLEEAP